MKIKSCKISCILKNNCKIVFLLLEYSDFLKYQKIEKIINVL